MKYGVPHTSILGSLLFITYTNDLLLRINSASEPILYADDTSVIISSRNIEDFHSMSNFDLSHMIKAFAANKLVPNLDATDVIKFITKNSTHSTLRTGYREKYVAEAVNTTFLGLQIDNHLNWENDIEQMIA